MPPRKLPPRVKASYVVEWPRCPRDMTPTVRPWNISVTCWELSHKHTGETLRLQGTPSVNTAATRPQHYSTA